MVVDVIKCLMYSGLNADVLLGFQGQMSGFLGHKQFMCIQVVTSWDLRWNRKKLDGRA